MSDEAMAFLVVVVLVLIVACVAIGWKWGKHDADSCWRRQAVSRGHAEYITTAGEPVWRWREIGGRE